MDRRVVIAILRGQELDFFAALIPYDSCLKWSSLSNNRGFAISPSAEKREDEEECNACGEQIQHFARTTRRQSPYRMNCLNRNAAN